MRNASQSVLCTAVVAGAFVALSCRTHAGDEGGAAGESSEARLRVADLRARFGLPGARDAAEVISRALVELPRRANEWSRVEDERSHLTVRFVLEHVLNAPFVRVGTDALSASALHGADVIERVYPEGVEDFVVFDARPAREELTYVVDVSRVAGLRLVGRTLELLDETGTPRLQVAPPYVVDALHVHHDAALTLEDCAYDASPAAPWGRKITAPGAARCTVRIRWSGVTYPAMVDPAWTTTGAIGLASNGIDATHTATLLPSGRVLFTGGQSTHAVLYDPATSTFAATGSMGVSRTRHTASLVASGAVLVVGGGITPNETTGAELYDPTTGTFSTTGSLTHGRGQHTATVLPSGNVLVTGGVDDATAEVYDTVLGSFAATGSMATARTLHTATLLGTGKVLVVGGNRPLGAPPYGVESIYGAELYDPATRTFAGAGLTMWARWAHTATMLPSGKVLVAGGNEHDLFPGLFRSLGSAELYDPATGSFGLLAGMFTARADHQTASLTGGNVLMIGGESLGISVALPSVELYDAAPATFSKIGSLHTGRRGHSATTLHSGVVLVVGGRDKSGNAPPAELFSPVTTGGTCQFDGDCTSGLCDDGVCCLAPCGGTCSRCALGSGACVTVTSGEDKNSCAGTRTCNGAGECKLKDGEPCVADSECLTTCVLDMCTSKGANGAPCNVEAECTSGFCVDRRCCNSACTGGCDACDAAPGACVAIDGAPRGSRPACAPGTACSAETARCETVLVPSAPQSPPSAPTRAACEPDHTLRFADGTTQDCTPYKCDDDVTCRNACSSVSDCVAPFVCDVSGTCVVPPDPPASAGCAVALARGSDARLSLGPLAVLLLSVARRKARVSRS